MATSVTRWRFRVVFVLLVLALILLAEIRLVRESHQIVGVPSLWAPAER